MEAAAGYYSNFRVDMEKARCYSCPNGKAQAGVHGLVRHSSLTLGGSNTDYAQAKVNKVMSEFY